MRNFLNDWRTSCAAGLIVIVLTLSAVALGVDRPVRAAVQVAAGFGLVAIGVYEWKSELDQIREKRETA